MIRVLSLIAIVSLFNYSIFAQSSLCGDFHRKNCAVNVDKNEDWKYNAQSRSGLFKQGMVSKIRCVIYKGMDYRFSVCCETTLGDHVEFKIYDTKTHQLLYDSNAGPEDEREIFEFECAQTRSIEIEVKVPVGSTDQQSHKPVDAACVGLLILHKVSTKSGF